MDRQWGWLAKGSQVIGGIARLESRVLDIQFLFFSIEKKNALWKICLFSVYLSTHKDYIIIKLEIFSFHILIQ